MQVRFWLSSLLAVSCSFGCGTLELTKDEYARVLSINVDGDTFPIEVESLGERADLQQQVDHICQELNAHRSDASLPPHVRNHVVLSIHGGLVSRNAGLESARSALWGGIDEAGYPIFVNWETGMRQSYVNHLFHVRGGRARPVLAFFSSPLYFLADAGRALFRLPITLTQQGLQNLKELAVEDEPECVPCEWKGTAYLDREGEEESFLQWVGRGAQNVVPGAVRPLTTALLDAVGIPAYSNMRRRARVLFLWDVDFEEGGQSGVLSRLARRLRALSKDGKTGKCTEDELREKVPPAVQADEPVLLQDLCRCIEDFDANVQNPGQDEREEQLRGALDAYTQGSDVLPDSAEQWLQALQRATRGHGSHPYQEDCPECARVELVRNEYLERVPLQITIVAHSMGALVANEFLRRNPDLVVRDIVYMGAACSIHDFADTALVYVKQNPFAHFHNLCLHPAAERGERSYWGTMPHGSLLEWIDDYITDHHSELDRTLGKWDNVMRALPVLDYLTKDVCNRIHIRGFRREKGTYPVLHGEFNDFEYWDPQYWNPRAQEVPTQLDSDQGDEPWYAGRSAKRIQ